MSLPMLVAVFARSRATLGARLVLLALAEHAHDDGTNAFPAVATLAERSRLTSRGVQKALRKLEDLGEIERTGKTRNGTTIWRVVLPEGGEQSSPPGANLVRGGGEPGSPEPSTKKGTSKTSTKSRARDALFDALALACGFKLEAMTREAARLCGIATAEIRAVGGEPDQVGRAVSAYRALYEGAAVTPKAIANHWPKIVPEKRAPGTSFCSFCGRRDGDHEPDCTRPKEET